jgi:hypothetical protein
LQPNRFLSLANCWINHWNIVSTNCRHLRVVCEWLHFHRRVRGSPVEWRRKEWRACTAPTLSVSVVSVQIRSWDFEKFRSIDV